MVGSRISAGPSMRAPRGSVDAVVVGHRHEARLAEVGGRDERRLGRAGGGRARVHGGLARHGRRAHLPEQALEVLAGLAHGEDALVRLVERVLERGHAAVADPARDGNVELPDLRAVAGLDRELLARRDRVDVGEIGEERVGALLDVGQHLVDGVGVERPRLGVAAARELRDHVREERAAGRERAGRGRAAARACEPSSRAIGTTFRPEAPPPATSEYSRGSMPCAIVISRIAPITFSVAIVRAA